ncbi:MAG: G/U mismatch-specific DNA glycosylase [Syntrophobacteraceae bacterium]|nr:G/U mismatch-specific DNA glycosylase [Syntrophobacteraceae bacterium]
MHKSFKPTKKQILDAKAKTVSDLIAPGLKVLFCGINPGLYTAATGRHFARPGNRFWPALYHAGFTPRLFSPFEEENLLRYGCGIVNLVQRATARADEPGAEELAVGGRALAQKVLVFKPRFCAVPGLGAYRRAFLQPEASPGPGREEIAGISTARVLPGPSGINANYPMKELVRLLIELREATEKSDTPYILPADR